MYIIHADNKRSRLYDNSLKHPVVIYFLLFNSCIRMHYHATCSYKFLGIVCPELTYTVITYCRVVSSKSTPRIMYVLPL